ncbi:hypothetical protein HMPREF0454_00457 [Hafnia alvei ATCC 51873]|uniref:Uncharacterized protein n=1 Tax=Hafnia alvei ATCC 51873 TaxID=1002364 RepID=G9Y1P0_HAFAL|nr:hypothetical protein HMPREF0454_00457 [Hafnia alvei ATCC 51873]
MHLTDIFNKNYRSVYVISKTIVKTELMTLILPKKIWAEIHHICTFIQLNQTIEALS